MHLKSSSEPEKNFINFVPSIVILHAQGKPRIKVAFEGEANIVRTDFGCRNKFIS